MSCDRHNSSVGFGQAEGQLLRTALGVAIILSSAHAWSQPSSTDSESATPPNKDSDTKLGVVKVDGKELEPASLKFTAPLVDTPMSVTILSKAVMQDTAATSLQDALRNVPGITFAAGEGGTPTGDLPSIRGFNSSGNLYVDGLRDIGVQSRDIFDLEQVEVVKGPDSSISGRASGGGSINMVSKTAQSNNFAEIIGAYGTAGQYRTTFDGNLKLADQIAVRVNMMKVGGGVPGRDSAVRADKVGFAPTITFGLDTPSRFIFNWYHFEDNGTPDYGVPVDFSNTGLPLTQTEGLSRKNYYGLADRDFRHNSVNSGTARFEHDFEDDWVLRSQIRYSSSENDYVLTLPMVSGADDVYRLPVGNRDETRSLINGNDLFGHFSTGSINHDMDIGFEASQEKERLAGAGPWDGYTVVSSAGVQGFSASGDCSDSALVASYDCTNLQNPNPHDPWRGTITPNTAEVANFTTRNYAPYVFDTMTLSPQWKVNAGVRWDWYSNEASDPSNPEDWGGSDQVTFLSYQLGLMFKPVENGTIYLSTSSAAIPEGQAVSGSGQDQSYTGVPGSYSGTVGFKPEKTHSLELGTKWNLFDNSMLLSGDVFVENHTDALISVTQDVSEQSGETRSKGVELSANGSITQNWNVIAGYSYIDAKILKGGIYDEVGSQVPNTPSNTASLWSTYRVVPAFTLGGGAYYRSKQIGYAGGYEGAPDRYIDGYWRFDTMAKWQLNSRIALQLNVQNLFDKEYYSKSFYWYAVPAPGRTYVAAVDVKF